MQEPRETPRNEAARAGRAAADDATARAKQSVREEAIGRRDALSDDRRERLSRAVCERAWLLPELAEARVLLLFASFRSELDTAPLIDWALSRGQVVALPRVLGPRAMAAFRILDARQDLVEGRWGIPEPRDGLVEVAPAEIDTVVVPGVCFTEDGDRCGYGGGFYDTFLPQTRPQTSWVALAFEVQLVDDLPAEPHDLPVDVVVTEQRVLRTGAR